MFHACHTRGEVLFNKYYKAKMYFTDDYSRKFSALRLYRPIIKKNLIISRLGGITVDHSTIEPTLTAFMNFADPDSSDKVCTIN